MSIATASALLIMQQLVTQPVARADYLAVMDAQYTAMDMDGNGAVTAEEIARQQAEAQAAQVVAANREIFVSLDADGNGMLSPDEFLRLAAAPQPVDATPTMQRLDLNGDGSVTLVEHRTIMLSTFDAIDLDKDGVVTPAESEAAAQAQAQAASQGR